MGLLHQRQDVQVFLMSNRLHPDVKRLSLRRLLAARLLPQSRLPLALAGRLEGDVGVLHPSR